MKKKLEGVNPDDIKLIRQAMTAQRLQASPLVNTEQKENEKTLELTKRASSEKRDFEQGYDLFIKEIKKKAIDGFFVSGNDVTPVPAESFNLNEKVRASTSNIEYWKDYVDHPYELQLFLGYSDNMLLNLYNAATLFYENQQYQDAAKGYKFLCLINPAISSFWVGLGLALEANNELTEGMKAFEKGIDSSPSEFTSYLGLIRCSERLKDFSRAIELLSIARENSLLENDADAALEYIASISK